MDSQRPPEPLKDRLATIVQRGHVEKRTSDEVAEMVMLEYVAYDREHHPHRVFADAVNGQSAALNECEAVARIAELGKDAARLDWLERTRPEVEALAETWEVGGWYSRPTLRAAIDAAISAATKEAQ